VPVEKPPCQLAAIQQLSHSFSTAGSQTLENHTINTHFSPVLPPLNKGSNGNRGKICCIITAFSRNGKETPSVAGAHRIPSQEVLCIILLMCMSVLDSFHGLDVVVATLLWPGNIWLVHVRCLSSEVVPQPSLFCAGFWEKDTYIYEQPEVQFQGKVVMLAEVGVLSKLTVCKCPFL
jgi:hypothetical protein